MKFDLGTILMTRDISNKVKDDADFEAFVNLCLKRYSSCDWGDLPEEDKKLNEEALNPYEPGMVHGVYTYPKTGDTVWIILEANRSHTTVLFPSEY